MRRVPRSDADIGAFVDQAGAEIWRGGVTPWQCDEMGHMNVRFYLSIATEALVGLAALLGMPRAFTAEASSTLLVREHHVRFLQEARAGAGLFMTGGVLSMGETEAVLLLMLFHSTGEPAAAFTTRVIHVTPDELRPFPWSRATRARAEAMKVKAPDCAAPRGITGAPVASTQASATAADAFGLPVVASGALGAHDCDVFGRMAPEQVLARIYASVGHVFRRSHAALLAAAPHLAGRLGGAAVEYRVLYHAWPKAGDRLVLRSGHRKLTAKSRSVVHWLLDPASDRPWATAEVVSLFLDLQARRALTIPDEALAAMAVDPIEALGL
jgi:acyl-CoA thioester hydrolase